MTPTATRTSTASPRCGATSTATDTRRSTPPSARSWGASHTRRCSVFRTSFICLENAYHGDTLGAVSVGGIDTFHSLYRPLLFDTWQARAGDDEHLESLLRHHSGRVAAVIAEPLVQGAAGMLMQPRGYL